MLGWDFEVLYKEAGDFLNIKILEWDFPCSGAMLQIQDIKPLWQLSKN